MQVNKITIGMLLLVTWSVYAAEYDESQLLNLFTDRQQRSQIEALRSGAVSDKGVRETNKINLNGYMRRSDGKSVVWVNDGNTIEGTRVDDLRVHSTSVGKDSKVTISVDGKTARLKPGETWIKETGKIVDNY
jgi:hypothetical protein